MKQMREKIIFFMLVYFFPSWKKNTSTSPLIKNIKVKTKNYFEIRAVCSLSRTFIEKTYYASNTNA